MLSKGYLDTARTIRPPGLPGRQDPRTRLTVKKGMGQHSRRSSVLRREFSARTP
jgi:hypothetical protein